jgi:hypothetical protein
MRVGGEIIVSTTLWLNGEVVLKVLLKERPSGQS